MKPIVIFCALLFLSLSSCRSNAEGTYMAMNGNANYSNIQTKARESPSHVDIYTTFIKEKEKVEKILDTASEEEANELYEKYWNENINLLLKINEYEHFSLAKYYFEDTDSKNMIRILSQKLEKNGLRIRELGEYEVCITTASDFYYNIFSQKVTKDLWKYLAIKTEEDNSPCITDDALSISIKELANRIMKRESFIRQFPHSIMLRQVKQEYKEMQLYYLLGVDNTPTVDRFNPDSVYVYYDNKMEYDRFSKEHPDSPTTKLIQFFLANFKKGNIRNLIMEVQKGN